MQRNTRLVGPGWNVPVEYWMAFTYMGHGFHDAPWRNSFGGPDYSWGGSHGCVNMPNWAAADLYSKCYVGLEVRVHY